MKKLFSTLLLVFFFTSFQAFADGEFTTRQLALRSEIQSFLKQEGFMPEIDSDGDIKFKREGNTYYVRIDKANKSPMYVRLQSYYSYSDNLSKNKISAARLKSRPLWDKGTPMMVTIFRLRLNSIRRSREASAFSNNSCCWKRSWQL